MEDEALARSSNVLDELRRELRQIEETLVSSNGSEGLDTFNMTRYQSKSQLLLEQTKQHTELLRLKSQLSSSSSSSKSFPSVAKSALQVPSTMTEKENNLGVEILIHNVSHSDLVVALNNTDRTLKRDDIIARPKFNCFKRVSNSILNSLRDKETTYSVEAPLHPIIENYDTKMLPIGFDLSRSPLRIEDVSHLKFRRDDKLSLILGSEKKNNNDNKTTSSDSSDSLSTQEEIACNVEYIYFPLVSVLVPKWLARNRDRTRRIIYLITGVASPTKQTDLRGQMIIDNSTDETGQLMKEFIETHYTDCEVICVHSTTNLFRYDENIVFVKNELLPMINKHRNQLAGNFGSQWRSMMHVTMSFADGSSARINAINAALRIYRPSYLHFWQIKTFWHNTIISEDDIEAHSFEEIGTVPATLSSNTSAEFQLIVNEMKSFKTAFNEVKYLPDGSHDLSTFWLRKTKKPVLAVLLVRRSDGSLKLYRGTNMEVSMPTGSLCAERNVIGSALADNVALKREDLIAVAVLSVNLDKEKDHKEYDSSRDMYHAFGGKGGNNDTLLSRIQRQSSRSESFDNSPSSPISATGAHSDHQRGPQPVPSPQSSSGSGGISKFPDMSSLFCSACDQNGSCNCANLTLSPSSKKVVGIRGISDDSFFKRTGSALPLTSFKETGRVVQTVRVDDNDMNPLKPCGACTEWIKKICEQNPTFSVITFTDSNCSGIYIEQIDSS